MGVAQSTAGCAPAGAFPRLRNGGSRAARRHLLRIAGVPVPIRCGGQHDSRPPRADGLADCFLNGAVDRPVIDKTGLRGNYDIASRSRPNRARVYRSRRRAAQASGAPFDLHSYPNTRLKARTAHADLEVLVVARVSVRRRTDGRPLPGLPDVASPRDATKPALAGRPPCGPTRRRSLCALRYIADLRRRQQTSVWRQQRDEWVVSP